MTEQCGTCRYYYDAKPTGECRRYPDKIRKTAEQWCGEWRIHPSQELVEHPDDVAERTEKMIRGELGAHAMMTRAITREEAELIKAAAKPTPAPLPDEIEPIVVLESDLDPPQDNAKTEGQAE